MKFRIEMAAMVAAMTCIGNADAQVPSGASVAPTDAQLASIRHQLATVAGTPGVRQDVTAASPIIEATIIAISCATEATALRSLNGRRLVPHNYHTPDDALDYTAMGGMHYHDRKACVDLNRIAKVTKPALNALQLELSFVSASSGEAKVQTVSFRKVGDQWLLDHLTDFEIDMP